MKRQSFSPDSLTCVPTVVGFEILVNLKPDKRTEIYLHLIGQLDYLLVKKIPIVIRNLEGLTSGHTVAEGTRQHPLSLSDKVR